MDLMKVFPYINSVVVFNGQVLLLSRDNRKESFMTDEVKLLCNCDFLCVIMFSVGISEAARAEDYAVYKENGK